MIIQKDGKRLLQAGTFRTMGHDEYSISVEVYGLDEKTGDGVTYRIVLGNGELNAIARYCAVHGLLQRLDPNGLLIDWKPDPE